MKKGPAGPFNFGAPTGTTKQPETLINARFQKTAVEKYRQKYRYFSKCPTCCGFDTP
jgi:hypothetical protein